MVQVSFPYSSIHCKNHCHTFQNIHCFSELSCLQGQIFVYSQVYDCNYFSVAFDLTWITKICIQVRSYICCKIWPENPESFLEAKKHFVNIFYLFIVFINEVIIRVAHFTFSHTALISKINTHLRSVRD